MTFPSLLKNITSIGKRIKKEWMQLEGDKIKASPLFKDLRFSRPMSLLRKVLASCALSARRVFLLMLIIFILP